VSRLTDLLKQARNLDPQLGADLEVEFRALRKRRTFGLVFEQHRPEAVELPNRPVRRGDKVRILPPRGETRSGDQRLWRVTRIEGHGTDRVAHLRMVDDQAEDPETCVAPLDDLVTVAEFRDPVFPGLVETGRVERGGDKPYHTVINAENFHALELLTYTHRHRVDAIYIDPPYNTGARDWKYNNDYVEADDDYRHSKWLAMMERRLKIARELLNPDDSVLIVTIDEKEYERLGLLLEQTFPDARIQMVSAVMNPGGSSRSGEFSRVNEFLYFTMLGESAPTRVASDYLFSEMKAPEANRSPIWRSLLRSGTGAMRDDSPAKFYPVLVDPTRPAVVGAGDPLNRTADKHNYTPPDGLVAVWPLKPDGREGRWDVNRKTFDLRLREGHIRVGRLNTSSKQYTIYYLRSAEIARLSNGELVVTGKSSEGHLEIEYSSQPRALVPKTVWNVASHDAGTYGSSLLKQLVPNGKFPFPKSLYAVEDTLRPFVEKKQDAVILDFFAGSGTTAHAVMRLNRQDGGRRQSILVTNNEVAADEQKALRKQGLRPGDAEWERWGICDYITKPRIEAAITGRTPSGEPIKGDYKFTDEFPMAEGFEENVQFMELTYLDADRVDLGLAFDDLQALLWLRAGGRGPIARHTDSKGKPVPYAWTDHYGILFDTDQWRAFVSSRPETARAAFVVTYSSAVFASIASELPTGMDVVRLYDSYLSRFQPERAAD
jgi:adenine-specific DNA-methyltransferase